MKAIIIAAGKGKRIAEKFHNIPKSLIMVNGRPIIEIQRSALELNGVSEFVIITGPENKFTYNDIQYVRDIQNKDHDVLGSLLVAADHIRGDVIISYSDILFDQTIVKQLLDTDGDIVIAVDMNWRKAYENRTEHPLSEADNVLFDEKKRIVKIKKDIRGESKRIGEFLGIMKMTARGSKIFADGLERLQKNHTGRFHSSVSLKKAYVTDMIQHIIESSPSDVVVVRPSFVSGNWCEIDTQQDYNNACKKFPIR